MDGFVIYDFKIDAWTPETMPLKRLAEYSSELARLFGSTADVHLLKITRGSHVQSIAVSQTANATVHRQLALVATAQAPRELLRPYMALNGHLRTDGASAVLRLKGGARIIDFPGCKTPLSDEVIVHEAGSIEGVVIRVGGKDDTVPVWLEGENSERLTCTASRTTAKELAAYLFGHPVRLHGNGKWRRDADRVWEMVDFSIKSWEPTGSAPLDSLVERLRAIPDNGWALLDDPQAELQRIRGSN